MQDFTRLSRPLMSGVWPCMAPTPSSCQVARPRNNCQRGRGNQSSNPCFSCNLSKLFSVFLTVVFPVFTHFWNVVYCSISTQLYIPNCLAEMHPGLEESHEDGWTSRTLGAGHVIANQHLITLDSSYSTWRGCVSEEPAPPLRGFAQNPVCGTS